MKKVSKLFGAGVLVPVSAVFLASWLWASPVPLSPRVTAKAHLVHAQDLAKKWQADATLVDILGPNVDANGISSATSSYSWSYTFVSKKTDKVFMISVANAADVAALSKVMTDNSYLFYVGSDAGLTGSVQERVAVGAGCQALQGEFLDSDKAMAAAKSAGYKSDSHIDDMQLSRCDGRPAVWKIRAFEIDAVTGKQLKSGG